MPIALHSSGTLYAVDSAGNKVVGITPAGVITDFVTGLTAARAVVFLTP